MTDTEVADLLYRTEYKEFEILVGYDDGMLNSVVYAIVSKPDGPKKQFAEPLTFAHSIVAFVHQETPVERWGKRLLEDAFDYVDDYYAGETAEGSIRNAARQLLEDRDCQ